MGRFFRFWWLCAREAFPGNASVANDWQWVIANPWWQSIGASVGGAFGAFFASHWGEAPMISPETPIGIFLGGLFGFVVTWIIAFTLRFIKAPAVLYYREKDRADGLLAETEKKGLNAQIEQAIFGEQRPGESVCLINVTVSNTSIPTIVDNWRISISRNGVGYPCRLTSFPPGIMTLQSNALVVTLTRADAIYDKASITPIPTGGRIRGWLYVIIREISKDQLDVDGTIIQVNLNDVLGKHYCATQIIKKSDAGPLRYYPDGSGGPNILTSANTKG
jgi:hypothetical protein